MAWFNKSIVFFINIIFLIIAYWYVCEYNDNSCSCFTASKSVETWKVRDEKQLIIFETIDRIRYQKGKVRPVLTNSIDSGLTKIVAYLKRNPNKKLYIESSYLEKEVIDTAIFSNLGMMRATYIAKYLGAKGLDNGQISIASKPNTFEKVNEDKLIGGLHLSIKKFRIISKEQEKQLLQQALTVRFEKGEAKILDSLALTIFASYIEKMFLQNQQVSLLIVGYADQVGEEVYNEKLSFQRAKMVERFLVNKNVNTTKLKIKYKGEIDAPFHSDNLNRCVVLQLIEV